VVRQPNGVGAQAPGLGAGRQGCDEARRGGPVRLWEDEVQGDRARPGGLDKS
jgi:hypothetical protein